MPCVRSFWKKTEKNEKSKENEINDQHRSHMDGAFSCRILLRGREKRKLSKMNT